MRDIDTVVIHCSDSVWGTIEDIDLWHKEGGFRTEFYIPHNGFYHVGPDGQKFIHCGYHYVILNGQLKTNVYSSQLDGLIEFGRPKEIKGAHVKGHNSRSIGICLIGKDSFTPKQYSVLINLIEDLKKQIPTIKNILGHYQLDDKKTCPNFNVPSFVEKHFSND